MDNVCHTLAGAALAESGLARRTSLGFATLLIGANLPDLDVLAFLGGPLADLEWRRGWSHGIVALAVLPFGLAAVMLLVDRLSQRLRRAVLPSGARGGQLLLLSAIGVASHPVLDTLNTYGVRWLLPWSGRWTYGDTLFIVDPWVWLVLGAGVWASRRRRLARERTVVPELPARRAILVAAAYILVMAISNVSARQIATAEMSSLHPGEVRAIMAAPSPVDPFRRRVVVEQPGVYRVADFHWFERPHIDAASIREFPAGIPGDAAAAQALRSEVSRRFLGWARFPSVSVDSDRVHIVDLRYTTEPGQRFGSVSIPRTPDRAISAQPPAPARAP
ncbi:MAG TPA: metal-dependent hydrolase [Gemmatimonadales bacterium]|nr:metal-dependent hydrolase [Gemmatimonadales bacterium]